MAADRKRPQGSADSDVSSAALYHEFRERGGMVALPDRAHFLFTGPDRVRYLNGQVTSDVTRLQPGESQPACVLTPKGKLCADVRISSRNESLMVDATATVREPLETRLARYIIADDVTLEDLSERRRVIHFLGRAPAHHDSVRANRFGKAGWDLLVATDEFEAAWEQLTEEWVVIDSTLLEAIRIEHGVPRWGAELDENTLPPEAGLDRTHIDYHKGCYVGQEIISRLKSVGHVNRRLLGFAPRDGTTPLASDMQLCIPANLEKVLGRVTSAAWSFALERPVALGYLKRDANIDELVAFDPTSRVTIPVIAQELPFVS